MRVAVFCSPTSWYFRDLQRAAAQRPRTAHGRMELAPRPFSGLSAAVGSTPPQADDRVPFPALQGFDAALIRTMPPGTLEQVVFRMDVLGRFQAAGGRVVNRPRAIEAAVDKYLTTARLAAAGLPTPPTHVCQNAAEAMDAFHELNADVVVKPLFGGEGRGILRVSDPALAHRTFRTLEHLGSVLYLQAFIPHEGADWRLLRIGDTVWGMIRRNPHDWRTNVALGGRGEPLTVTPALRDLAFRASQTVDAEIAGVDILPARDGVHYVLEVNAVPGWKALARVLDTDIARRVLDYLESTDRRGESVSVSE